jgi:hypothetical protein
MQSNGINIESTLQATNGPDRGKGFIYPSINQGSIRLRASGHWDKTRYYWGRHRYSC